MQDYLVQVIYGRHDITQEREGYAYHSGYLDLKIGDLVIVPPTEVYPLDQVATVVATHSDYPGPVRTILRRFTETPTEVYPLDQAATVVATHSDYPGPVKTILRRFTETPLRDQKTTAPAPLPGAVALEAVELIRSKLPPEAWHHALDDMAVWLNVLPAHAGCTFPGFRRLLEDAEKLGR